jgi:hypothetical protein
MLSSKAAQYLGAGTAVVLGLNFSQAAAFFTQDRQTFVRNTIQTMCADPAEPMIVDTFSGPDSHGNLVGTIYYATSKGRVPSSYNLAGSSVAAIANALHDIADGIEKGADKGGIPKPSYIILSLNPGASSGNHPYFSVNDLNQLDPSLGLTPENLREKREAALDVFLKHYTYAEDFRVLRAAFQKLERLGVATVTAAGNDFSAEKKFNILGLMSENVLVGGALKRDGKTPAPFSNKTSLDDFARVGSKDGKIVNSGNGSSGYDINGDGWPDFQISPEQQIVVDTYNGRTLAEVPVTDIPAFFLPDRGFANLITPKLKSGWLKPGLYRAKDFHELVEYPLSEARLQHIKEEGEYIEYPSRTHFTVGADGKLHAPDFTTGGTSIVPPQVCTPDHSPS